MPFDDVDREEVSRAVDHGTTMLEAWTVSDLGRVCVILKYCCNAEENIVQRTFNFKTVSLLSTNFYITSNYYVTL